MLQEEMLSHFTDTSLSLFLLLSSLAHLLLLSVFSELGHFGSFHFLGLFNQSIPLPQVRSILGPALDTLQSMLQEELLIVKWLSSSSVISQLLPNYRRSETFWAQP